MLLKHALIVAVLIVAICASASLSQKVEAAANLTVINSYSYRDVLNNYYLFGEVQNTGDTAATNIAVNVSFYDASDNFINSSITYIMLYSGMLEGKTFVLNPGAKAPFWMLLFSGWGTANFDHYTFTILFDECATKATGLQILSSSVFTYGMYNVNLTGTVKNGPTAQSGIDVYVAIYDSSGKVVGITSAGWINQNVDANAEVSFNFMAVVPEIYTLDIMNFDFRVIAQSPDYTAESAYTGVVVPEFPSLLATMLLMMVITAILVFCKKRQI